MYKDNFEPQIQDNYSKNRLKLKYVYGPFCYDNIVDKDWSANPINTKTELYFSYKQIAIFTLIKLNTNIYINGINR